jgi:hypothetical protein
MKHELVVNKEYRRFNERYVYEDVPENVLDRAWLLAKVVAPKAVGYVVAGFAGGVAAMGTALWLARNSDDETIE